MAAWKDSLSRAVMYRSFGSKKICGIKFYAALLIEKGVVSSLFLSMMVLKISLSSCTDSPFPSIILYSDSGIPPSITFCLPIKEVYRNRFIIEDSFNFPPRICFPIVSMKSGVT